MNNLLYLLILLFGTASYFVGTKEMLQGKYSPSLFSRIIWLLLSINAFAGVILTGTSSSMILALIFLLGNLSICLVSFWKGTRDFGLTEIICTVLLVVSILIWVFFQAPLINLLISLVAHFIGGIPTYKKVWLNPKSESVGFWSLFFIASFLSLFTTETFDIYKAIFPLYFTIFDGSMFLLAMRKIKGVKI
ncbi:MAG: hypothetical protein WCO16_02045 [bacterium]